MRAARLAMMGLMAAALGQAFSDDATAAATRNPNAGQTFLSFDGGGAGFLTSLTQTQTSSGYQEVALFPPAAMASSF